MAFPSVGAAEAGARTSRGEELRIGRGVSTSVPRLLAANPFGRSHSGFPSQKDKEDLLKIAKGGEMKFKYGVYAHTGDVKAGKVAEAYEAFKK